VPFQKTGIGDYGKISGNLFSQVFLNFFVLSEIFFYLFSNNVYVFFLPFLFVAGLFWIKKSEKDFSVLFFVSFILFLFVTLISKASPTFTGFPRYFIPIYSLFCIFSGIQLKKIVLFRDKRIAVFCVTLFVLFMLFNLFLVLSVLYNEPNFSSGASYLKLIEDDSNTTVWFVDGGALKLRFKKATLYDFAWKADFSGSPCDFLRENEIDYVVYFHFPLEKEYSSYLGDFKTKLRQSLLEGKCSRKISGNVLEIFKVN
jgi:hypothetical protein